MKEIQTSDGKKFKYYTPKELKAHLDKYIIGQDEAKITMCVAVYNHYKRVILDMQKKSKNIEKSNVMCIGPTGCGKTAIMKCIAEYMEVPYYIADATTLTQAGYVGDDVESIISGLLRNSNYSVKLAEYGIIFIDEIDKIAKKGSNEHISRDVVGEGVQQALLKMVEGDKVGVPPQEGRKHPEQPLIYVNTKNILFVASGAFPGIEGIVSSRLNRNKIGYSSISDNFYNDKDFSPYEYVSHDDLRKFGMIPEFIGRFPIITSVNNLTKDDLVNIMKYPKNNIISQYNKMLSPDGIVIELTDDAYEYIADIAISLHTGARAIRSIMEQVMRDYVFELCGDISSDSEEVKSIVIDVDSIKEKIGKRYINFD